MASNPTPPAKRPHEKPLTREEWWDLLWSLEGSMKGWFPEEGGPSGVLRKRTRSLGRMKLYLDSMIWVYILEGRVAHP